MGSPGYRAYNVGALLDPLAASMPETPSLRDPEGDISLGALQGLTHQLCQILIERGLDRGDVIAIAHTKKFMSYALMLAGLRLGVPYVNIDIASPHERNARILKTCNPKFLFLDDQTAHPSMQALADEAESPLVAMYQLELPEINPEQVREQQARIDRVDGSTIAYIMFTSGSTGEPKGVAVTHQNLLHFIDWGRTRFQVRPGTVFANLSPMYFDNSVFDFYVGLFSGACLAPIPHALLTQPLELVQYVERMQCTMWFSVPSLLMYLTTMKVMRSHYLPSIRQIVFGGEGYPKVELKKLYDAFSPQASLTNVYGPTECTCICSAHTLDETDFEDMSGLPTLGRLNPNFDYRILDDRDLDASTGELCLIGPNVASGYYNDPERTQQAFFTIQEPNRYLKRLYRTGDMVAERGDFLYFIGRKDNQIKHMGYRIELEEIEHALVRLPQVGQACVVYLRAHTSYGKIVAYVACSTPADKNDILNRLRSTLPEYMIPSDLAVIGELPKNQNGKVDRKRILDWIEKGEA